MFLGQGTEVPEGKVKVILMRGVVTLAQTFADTNGEFTFDKLTEGDYDVVIESSGYRRVVHPAQMRYPGHEEEDFSARLEPLQQTARQEGIPQKAIDYFDRGVQLDRAGKPQEAARLYEKAVALAPRYAQAWNNLGGEYRILKRWTEAEQALRRALSLDPEAAVAHLNLGLLRLAQGRMPEARQSLQEAVQKDPGLATGHLLLGILAYQSNEMSVAELELRRALQLDPQGALEADLYLGSLLASQGKFPEATRLLEDYLKKNPPRPQAAKAEEMLKRIRSIEARR